MPRSADLRFDSRSALYLLFLAVMIASPSRGSGAEPAAPLTELGVDQVTLKSGERLRGAVVDRDAKGALTVAVSRQWLKSAHPTWLERFVTEETAARTAARAKLRDRLTEWIAQRPTDEELQFFLNKERERLDKAVKRDAPEDAPFLLLTFARDQVEQVYSQTAERKQASLVAWRDGLADVERRSARSLASELQKKGTDPFKERVDLSDMLPVRSQSDAEWAARKAIVEYQFRKPLEYQGTGEFVARTGDGVKPPDTGAMLASVLRSQLTSQLGQLFDEPGAAPRAKPAAVTALDAAIRQTAGEDVLGFRLTSVTPDVATQRVGVETRFVVKLPGEGWTTVWQFAETRDASRPDKDAEEQIMNDPQVSKLLEMMRGTGLANGDETIRRAVRFGAATMQAQKAADGRFFEFRDRYLQRLDTPPIWLPPGK